MSQEKIPHVHKDRGRYYYRRKVPADFQDVVGVKEWREPVGESYTDAVRQVLKLTEEHDKLLSRLQNPEHRRDHQTAVRRDSEARQTVKNAADDAA